MILSFEFSNINFRWVLNFVVYCSTIATYFYGEARPLATGTPLSTGCSALLCKKVARRRSQAKPEELPQRLTDSNPSIDRSIDRLDAGSKHMLANGHSHPNGNVTFRFVFQYGGNGYDWDATEAAS